MPPPKPPLTAISEPDPIYPYLPFLFCSSFGNDRATTAFEDSSSHTFSFAGLSLSTIKISAAEVAKLVQVPYKSDSTNERLSLGVLRQRFDELVDFGRGVVEMRSYPQSLVARSSDDVSLSQLNVEVHC